METEIIKTDDPNVVIERTVTETEINIQGLTMYKESLISMITDLQAKSANLKACPNLPASVQEIVANEISEIEGNIFSYEQELIRVNAILE